MGRKEKDYSLIIIAIIVFAFVVLYLLSLGKIKGTTSKSRYDELNESLEKANARHTKLQALIDKKVELKEKLKKRFRWIFFSVRILLVAFWAVALILLYLFGIVVNIGDALNYSNAFILVLITLNFITFGNLTNLSSFINAIKTRVENWVYGKYVSIDGIIEVDNLKLVEDKKGTEVIQEEIKNINELPAKE
jgi:ABC-type multidrug transport system fused ATPase/permease subunit